MEDTKFSKTKIEDTLIDNATNVIEKIILKANNDKLYKLLDEKLDDIENKIVKMSFGIG